MSAAHTPEPCRLPDIPGKLGWCSDRLIMAEVRLGRWMSAALDDPNVCDEMKADIREWFSAGEPRCPFHCAEVANAAPLIAAAPELLETLRRLTIDLDAIANANQVPGHVAYHSKLGMVDIAQRALAAVEAAIAKAEGK